MPRFLDRIIFIDSSGQEQTVAGGSVSDTPGTLALRDTTGRFLVGDTDSSSSTDGHVVVNKNYIDNINYSDIDAGDRKYVSKVTQTKGQIAVEHVNFGDAKATDSSYGFIKTGYSTTNKNYAVKLNNNGDAYVNVPWQNTTYSIVAGYSGTGSSGLIKLSGSSVSSQSQTTKFMREDGTWAAPSYTNIYSHNITFTAQGGYKVEGVAYSTKSTSYTKDEFSTALSTCVCVGGALLNDNYYVGMIKIKSIGGNPWFALCKFGTTDMTIGGLVSNINDFNDICNII